MTWLVIELPASIPHSTTTGATSMTAPSIAGLVKYACGATPATNGAYPLHGPKDPSIPFVLTLTLYDPAASIWMVSEDESPLTSIVLEPPGPVSSTCAAVWTDPSGWFALHETATFAGIA